MAFSVFLGPSLEDLSTDARIFRSYNWNLDLIEARLVKVSLLSL